MKTLILPIVAVAMMIALLFPMLKNIFFALKQLSKIIGG